MNLGSSRRFFFFFYCRLRNLLTVFSESRDVLAFFLKLVSVYIRRRNFYDLRIAQWRESGRETERV